MKPAQFMVTKLDPMSKGLMLSVPSGIPILQSLVRHALFDINPSQGSEIRVESNRNLVAFGEAHLTVDLRMVS